MTRCSWRNPLSVLVILASVSFVGCDSSNDASGCLTVTPDQPFAIAGTAATMNFAPDSKTYVVQNDCSSDVMLSVEEDVRWLDVEIDAFEPLESGIVQASSSVDVQIETRYGSDNPERLDQLSAGTYSAVVRFIGDGDGGRVDRSVQLTVNAP